MEANVQKTDNGHVLEFLTISGQGGEVEELVVWCTTCDPKGERYIFQRDFVDTADNQPTIQDAVQQAKLHTTLAANGN